LEKFAKHATENLLVEKLSDTLAQYPKGGSYLPVDTTGEGFRI